MNNNKIKHSTRIVGVEAIVNLWIDGKKKDTIKEFRYNLDSVDFFDLLLLIQDEDDGNEKTLEIYKLIRNLYGKNFDKIKLFYAENGVNLSVEDLVLFTIGFTNQDIETNSSPKF